MAKLKPRFYAQALYELIDGKSGQELATATTGLLQVLQKNRQLQLWPQVMAAYQQIVAEKRGVILAQVKTEKPLTETEKRRIRDFLQQNAGAKEVELMEEVAKVGACLIVETAEKCWDLSLENQIEAFKKQLIS